MHPLHYLGSLAHFQKTTDGMKGSSSTDVQMGLVVGLEDADKVITLSLKKKKERKKEMKKNLSFCYFPNLYPISSLTISAVGRDSVLLT